MSVRHERFSHEVIRYGPSVNKRRLRSLTDALSGGVNKGVSLWVGTARYKRRQVLWTRKWWVKVYTVLVGKVSTGYLNSDKWCGGWSNKSQWKWLRRYCINVTICELEKRHSEYWNIVFSVYEYLTSIKMSVDVTIYFCIYLLAI